MEENTIGLSEQCHNQLYFVCYTLCVASLIIIVIFISMLNTVGTKYFNSEMCTEL